MYGSYYFHRQVLQLSENKCHDLVTMTLLNIISNVSLLILEHNKITVELSTVSRSVYST